MNNYNAIVISGGGIKIISDVGAIYFLNKNVKMNIKCFVGTSAGAILATLLASKFGEDEIKDIMMITDFEKFLDNDSFFPGMEYVEFFEKKGLYLGTFFQNWFENLLFKKTNIHNITFQQLFGITGNELVIVSTDYTTQKVVYFHHSTFPNYTINEAVRASISIPCFYLPVLLNINDPKEKDILIDGGCLNNFPMNFHKEMEYFKIQSPKIKCLGITTLSSGEISKNPMVNGRQSATNVFNFAQGIIEMLLLQIERLQMNSKDWENTIAIPNINISSVDFGLSINDKINLFQSGYNAAQNFNKSKNLIKIYK